MKKLSILLFLFFASGLLNCAEPQLTRSKAADLLSVRLVPITMQFKAGVFCMDATPDVVRQIANDPQSRSNQPAAGFLITLSLGKSGLSELRPYRKGCYNVFLTEQGKKHVLNGNWKVVGPVDGGLAYEVVMMSTKVSEVTGIAMSADKLNADIEFNVTLSVAPQRDLFFPNEPQGAPRSATRAMKATFRLWDDGWRVMTIDGQPVPETPVKVNN